ncbi:hypothetical protein M011DRAFT_18374 [Sporormia fimetaria CBS 119925]|uniref:Uncharacterized protein n=1 Tax=Sporormia fimetaria CBS 119925 TaxID=1340428 RepID=A0A6A6VSH5_9PLEO|nr:hypothetical protein M011DRAFT_18374 [Sporormia fimetaria CBS 119925]
MALWAGVLRTTPGFLVITILIPRCHLSKGNERTSSCLLGVKGYAVPTGKLQICPRIRKLGAPGCISVCSLSGFPTASRDKPNSLPRTVRWNVLGSGLYPAFISVMNAEGLQGTLCHVGSARQGVSRAGRS